MHLKGSLTIGDLARMGATISLVPRGTPLANGEWKDVSTPDTSLPNVKGVTGRTKDTL